MVTTTIDICQLTGLSVDDDPARAFPWGTLRWAPRRRRLPLRLWLGGLRDGRLRVVAPLAVRVQRVNGQMVAEAGVIGACGYGATWMAAVIDLQRAVGELYRTLEAEHHRLGPELARVWTVLQAYVQRREIRHGRNEA